MVNDLPRNSVFNVMTVLKVTRPSNPKSKTTQSCSVDITEKGEISMSDYMYLFIDKLFLHVIMIISKVINRKASSDKLL